jgi:hypothetical protein
LALLLLALPHPTVMHLQVEKETTAEEVNAFIKVGGGDA